MAETVDVYEGREVKYEMREVNALIPYARNARTHSREQIQQICGSIKEFGFMNPVIVSEDGGIVCGHGRVMAAQRLGLTKVPCIVESHLTEAQKRAYILADNRIALNAGWDSELMQIELGELKEQDFDLDMLGFSDNEVEYFMKGGAFAQLDGDTSGGLEEEDGEKEIEVDEEGETISKAGDVWLLGEHRLICGDSTDKDVVEKLFAGATPNLMVTDPPYGTHYDPKTRKNRLHSKGREREVLNDDRASWKESYALFPGKVAYVWHSNLHSDVVFHDLRENGFELNSMIIWNKSNFAIGFSDYHWKHEPCVYATRGNHNWQGGRDKTTVWDIPEIRSLTKEEGSWGHSTQKPIECMKRPIENNSVRGEWVYDPFCGSGTTVISCERTKRKCLAVELSPQFCDAIVRRWEEETHKQAKLEETGELFDRLEEIKFGKALEY